MNTIQRGEQGERLAIAYLEKRGLRPIVRHFRTREGEIDLIFRDGRETVFVEVKYRRSAAFGLPEESVTRTKLQRIKRTIAAYLATHPTRRYRLDVVTIEDSDGYTNVRWLRNVG